MKEDKSLVVTVTVKKIEDCTQAELSTMLPLLTDENGVNYKQLSGTVPNTGSKPNRRERIKKTKE